MENGKPIAARQICTTSNDLPLRDPAGLKASCSAAGPGNVGYQANQASEGLILFVKAFGGVAIVVFCLLLNFALARLFGVDSSQPTICGYTRVVEHLLEVRMKLGLELI